MLRLLQEDAHCAVLDLDASSGTGFFGVFDGHGGKEVSRYAALHLVRPSTPVSAAGWTQSWCLLLAGLSPGVLLQDSGHAHAS